MTKAPDQNEVDQGTIDKCDLLARHFKNYGLEHGIQRMTMLERGETRRLIREALEVMARKLRDAIDERTLFVKVTVGPGPSPGNGQ